MLWTIFVILLVLWLLGFSFHIAGGLIHLLLVVAVAVSGNQPDQRSQDSLIFTAIIALSHVVHKIAWNKRKCSL